eukprot:CAMPEP_0115012704 /NCGR_PEP_ID=MMETSP0216-20121206/24912_1 /TAXON_ID=223996 /ORGANISM="Protocruzia adherens, Strain Boccale" /LENGTH=2334 /DNA_ID=CAMNT_0002381845 /DNA_START=106 /DNA_END=7109 /DNA_ORIENTATION=+
MSDGIESSDQGSDSDNVREAPDYYETQGPSMFHPGVEQILGERENAEDKSKEFLVKYQDISHLHLNWISEAELLEDGRNAKLKLNRFYKRVATDLDPEYDENGDRVYYDPQALEVERILYTTEMFPIIHPRQASQIAGKWQESCVTIVAWLLNYSKNHINYGIPFLFPVDPVEENAHDYLKVVKNPMDLGTCLNRLYNNFYKHHSQFWQDLGYVFKNCRMYTPNPNSDIRVLCDTTRELAVHLYKQWYNIALQKHKKAVEEYNQRVKEFEMARKGREFDLKNQEEKNKAAAANTVTRPGLKGGAGGYPENMNSFYNRQSSGSGNDQGDPNRVQGGLNQQQHAGGNSNGMNYQFNPSTIPGGEHRMYNDGQQHPERMQFGSNTGGNPGYQDTQMARHHGQHQFQQHQHQQRQQHHGQVNQISPIRSGQDHLASSLSQQSPSTSMLPNPTRYQSTGHTGNTTTTPFRLSQETAMEPSRTNFANPANSNAAFDTSRFTRPHDVNEVSTTATANIGNNMLSPIKTAMTGTTLASVHDSTLQRDMGTGSVISRESTGGGSSRDVTSNSSPTTTTSPRGDPLVASVTSGVASVGFAKPTTGAEFGGTGGGSKMVVTAAVTSSVDCKGKEDVQMKGTDEEPEEEVRKQDGVVKKNESDGGEKASVSVNLTTADEKVAKTVRSSEGAVRREGAKTASAGVTKTTGQPRAVPSTLEARIAELQKLKTRLPPSPGQFNLDWILDQGEKKTFEEYTYLTEEDIETVTPDNPPSKLYLIRWKTLSYAEATWERERNDFQNMLKEYRKYYQKLATPQKVRGRPPKLIENGEWFRKCHNFDFSQAQTRYEESPVFKDNLKLRNYQVESLNWFINAWYKGINCILADEMGLGKTIQIISFINHLATKCKFRGPFLIIAPLSTLAHWKNSARDWTMLNSILYHDNNGSEGREAMRKWEWFYTDIMIRGGVSTASKLTKFQIMITSYEVFIQDINHLKEIPFQYIVIDEAHRLKNKQAKLLVLLKELACKRITLLTGTPLQNNTEELWTLLNYIEPAKFNSREAFLEEFGTLTTFLLRRKKEDVEQSIPPLQETIIDVELTTMQKQYYRAIYEKNVQFLTRGVEQNNSMPQLNNLEIQLRKCCNHPFLIREAELAETSMCHNDEERFEKLLESSGKMILLDKLLAKLIKEGHKVLIFSQFKLMLNLLEEFLGHRKYPYERLDGSIRAVDRQLSIDRFNKGEKKRDVFLLSPPSDIVVIFDSDWNPQNDVQATARAHRIGQTNEVSVYRLITANTYEAQMFDRASKKLGLDQAVFSKGAFENSKKGREKEKQNKQEIERLLKKGAYSLQDDDDGTATKTFMENDIDDILKNNSRVVEYSQISGSYSFNKSTFISSTADQSIDIDDPEFWSKVLPARTSAANILFTKLNDRTINFTDAKIQADFMQELEQVVHDTIEAKINSHTLETTEDEEVVTEMLEEIGQMKSFEKESRAQATKWIQEINKPSRRFRRTENTQRKGEGGRSRRGRDRGGFQDPSMAYSDEMSASSDEDYDSDEFSEEVQAKKSKSSKPKDKAMYSDNILCCICERPGCAWFCKGPCKRSFHTLCLQKLSDGDITEHVDVEDVTYEVEETESAEVIKERMDGTWVCNDCTDSVGCCFVCKKRGQIMKTKNVTSSQMRGRGQSGRKPKSKLTPKQERDVSMSEEESPSSASKSDRQRRAQARESQSVLKLESTGSGQLVLGCVKKESTKSEDGEENVVKSEEGEEQDQEMKDGQVKKEEKETDPTATAVAESKVGISSDTVVVIPIVNVNAPANGEIETKKEAMEVDEQAKEVAATSGSATATSIKKEDKEVTETTQGKSDSLEEGEVDLSKDSIKRELRPRSAKKSVQDDASGGTRSPSGSVISEDSDEADDEEDEEEEESPNRKKRPTRQMTKKDIEQRAVFKCIMGNCGKFYHLKCAEEHKNTSFMTSKKEIKAFRCPLHYCSACEKSGDSKAMVQCTRCPHAYHIKCYSRDKCYRLSKKLILCQRHNHPFDQPAPKNMVTTLSSSKSKSSSSKSRRRLNRGSSKRDARKGNRRRRETVDDDLEEDDEGGDDDEEENRVSSASDMEEDTDDRLAKRSTTVDDQDGGKDGVKVYNDNEGDLEEGEIGPSSLAVVSPDELMERLHAEKGEEGAVVESRKDTSTTGSNKYIIDVIIEGENIAPDLTLTSSDSFAREHRLYSSSSGSSSRSHHKSKKDRKEKKKPRTHRPTNQELAKQMKMDYDFFKIDPPEKIDYSKLETWCRYCGARYSSNFSRSPWGAKMLCCAHYVEWNNNKKLDLDSYVDEPAKPIDLSKNTELQYLISQHFKKARLD